MGEIIKLRGHHLRLLVEYVILRDRGVNHHTIMGRLVERAHSRNVKKSHKYETELFRRIYEDGDDLRVRIITFFDDICTFPCKAFTHGIYDGKWPQCIGPHATKDDLYWALEYGIKSKFLNPSKELIDKIRSSSSFKQEEMDDSHPYWFV